MSVLVRKIKVSSFCIKNFCYLVVEDITGVAILIDPAWDIESIDHVIRECGASLFAILLTHYHADHVNLADAVAKKFDAKVFMSKEEIEHYGFRCHNLKAIEGLTPFPFGDCQVFPILTPGHTKGGLCYLIDGNLFTGDTLFAEGCGMCWGAGADPNAMFESLQLLKHLIPHRTRIYPGHSYGEEPGQVFEHLLKNNIYLNLNDRKQFVNFRMREKQTNIFKFA